jgi:hypothetical protein
MKFQGYLFLNIQLSIGQNIIAPIILNDKIEAQYGNPQKSAKKYISGIVTIVLSCHLP